MDGIKQRLVKADEGVYKITVSTLPAFPFTVSEELPILINDNPEQLRYYGELKNIRVYEYANKLLELYVSNPALSKQEIGKLLGISSSYISKILNQLEKDNKIVRLNRRKGFIVTNHKPYDLSLLRKRISWKQAKDVRIGDYAVYPRPKNIEETIMIDVADYLDCSQYIVLADYIYYGCGSLEFIEIVQYLRKHGIPTFNWGERKEFLQVHNWNDRTYERATAAVQNNMVQDLFPRYITISSSIAKMMGYWLAEGSATDGNVVWSFHKKEMAFCEDIDTALLEWIGRSGTTYPKGENGINHVVTCKPLAELLRNLFGARSQIKHLPDWFIEMDNSVLVEFLKGLFDGDGSYFEKGPRTRISLKTTSISVAYQVRLILLKLGIIGSIIENKPQSSVLKNGKVINGGVSYHLNINSKAAKLLGDLLGYQFKHVDYSGGETSFLDDEYVYLRVNKIDRLTPIDVPVVNVNLSFF